MTGAQSLRCACVVGTRPEVIKMAPVIQRLARCGWARRSFLPARIANRICRHLGLGLGADAYPYAGGFKPYWDFGTFGAWRTDDRRVLEDVHGNAGFLYGLRAPVRAAVGPTLLAVAGYDSKAATLWAAGVGPSLLAYVWLGGDKYRSYDALLTVQAGYIFAVGADERQSGWRAQVGITF
jgi:hypothetical protein